MFVHQASPNAVPQNGAQKTVPQVTATALQSTSPTIPAKVGVCVQSIAANTAKIYVGGSGVLTTTGIELAPGDSFWFPLGDPSKIYCISGSASQILQYVWV